MDKRFIIGVDVGGTFTDGVAVDEEGKIIIAKADSSKPDPTDGVMNALGKLAKKIGISLEELVSSTSRFIYGTTVATNALLERQGMDIALITTKGFRDQLNLRRIRRDNGYNLRAKYPDPFVRRSQTYEVTERIDEKGGVIEPLHEDEVIEVARQIRESGITSVAVSTLFSFLNPSHERRIREILYQEIPGVAVSISSDVCPEIREYERTSTVAINAYLTQTVQKHLESFEQRLIGLGMKGRLQIMQSSGGVTASKYITDRPVNIFLSGPAGGVMAAANIGMLSSGGEGENIISCDMGGTSFDITVLADNEIPLSMRSEISGWDIIVPSIDIQTIGSGGGSIAWVDSGNGMHVGPRSAGSVPGPVSYDAGGTEPTVTDADLVLGYIDPDYFLGGEMHLNKEKAEKAIADLGEKVGLSMLETAAGIYSIVNENMLGGMRVATLQRGHDPRDFKLVVFGGAASIHVPDFASELGLGHLIIPRDASVYSAIGLTIADLRFDFTKNINRNSKDITFEELMSEYDELKERGNANLEDINVSGEDRYYHLRADMKYPGEFNEFVIDIPEDVSSMEEIAGCFAAYHKDRYGYAEETMPDIINIRVSAFGRTSKPDFPKDYDHGEDSTHAVKGSRQAYFHEIGEMTEVTVYDGERLECGNKFFGPAIIELPTTTIVVRPGQETYVDEYGNFNIVGSGEG